jgi:hypothetical protein
MRFMLKTAWTRARKHSGSRRAAGRVDCQSADASISGQMRTLAEAFHAQAEILKKKRKKKK